MKPLFTVGLGLVFAAALLSGAGCALTNYELITDNDGRPVNTGGSAYVRQDPQIASEYPDGTDYLITMRVTFASGQQDDRSLLFAVRSR